MSRRRGRRRGSRAFLQVRSSDAEFCINVSSGPTTLRDLLQAASVWIDDDEVEASSLDALFGEAKDEELETKWTEELQIMRQMSAEEKTYFMAQSAESRQELARLLSESRSQSCQEPLRFRTMRSRLPAATKAVVLSKLARQGELQTSEFLKYQTWAELLVSVPLAVVLVPQPTEARSAVMAQARDHLDRVVYGHSAAKAAILERFFQWLVAPLAPQRPLALQGVPGNGKTTLVREGVAAIMGRPFVFIALGGSFDSSFLLGHNYTYEGSLPGRILDGLLTSKCMNPVFYFDELDKCSQSPRGDEIVNVLVHLTDLSQNDAFHDRYAGSLDLDVSRSLMVFTYNDPQMVSPVLLDRLQVVRTDAFDAVAQAEILRRHLLPRVLKELGLPEGHLTLDAEAAASLTRRVGESGVRLLRNALERATTKVSLWKETGDASFLAPLRPASVRSIENGRYVLCGDVSCLVADDVQKAAPSNMYI
jgi:ATP-dependent Lon protease